MYILVQGAVPKSNSAHCLLVLYFILIELMTLPMLSTILFVYFIIAILCRLYCLALYAGTLIDKQYNVIIVSVFCIMIVVNVCF